MKKLLPLHIATKGLMVIFSLTIVFHLLVLFNIVPSTIVWGGTISSHNQLIIMESISIFINILLLAVVCVYSGIIKIGVNPVVLKIIFWLMFGLFLLNTVGNLMSRSSLETYLFTPITVLLSFFCLQIAVFGFQNKKQFGPY